MKNNLKNDAHHLTCAAYQAEKKTRISERE